MLGVEGDLPIALQQLFARYAVDVQEDQQFGAALHRAGGAEVPGPGEWQIPVPHRTVHDGRGELPARQYRAEVRIIHRDDHVLVRSVRTGRQADLLQHQVPVPPGSRSDHRSTHH
ncbi:hypothetical protein AB0L39_18445 [Streptomyces parvus]|uniref:hypothetical protein n=1 Tax=Streptomyces parvus TaxID=66428 RepID=UPI0034318193